MLDVLERELEARGEQGRLRVLLHSLAFGTLRPFVAENPKETVSKDQMDMTLDVMAHSLVYWTQDVVARGPDGPWRPDLRHDERRRHPRPAELRPGLGRKAALESHVRQLAMELAPQSITVNAVRAGVTDTPALRKIPGSDRIKAGALARNPSGRLTTTEDVARAIVAFSHSSTYWMTGNVLGVDGGEDVVG